MNQLFVLLLVTLLVTPTAFSQGMGQHRGGGGGGNHADGAQDVIHALLADHDVIDRRIVDLPNGVEAWTESEDPEIAVLIRTHVHQMKARLESGQMIRRWDPLFEEIFAHADAIELVVEDTPNGVHIVETSDDPYVVSLIRQHAYRAINEFVEYGMDRAHEPTPLPAEEQRTD